MTAVRLGLRLECSGNWPIGYLVCALPRLISSCYAIEFWVLVFGCYRLSYMFLIFDVYPIQRRPPIQVLGSTAASSIEMGQR